MQDVRDVRYALINPALGKSLNKKECEASRGPRRTESSENWIHLSFHTSQA